MKQMLKKADSRSRRLNTIMEIAENQDENGNLVADSNPLQQEISRDICNITTLKRQQHRGSLCDTSDIYSPRERRIPCSHATPQTLSTASKHWREKASVSITPAGVVSNSSESLMGSPLKLGHDISEVELFFPEFFTGGEMQRSGKKTETIHKLELYKNIQSENEDPLVQSWLDLFGSQVYG